MRVAIVTAHLAHYRRQLYKLLDDTPDVTITHFAGGPNKRGILSLDATDVQRFKPLKNRQFFRSHWQSGVLRMALQGECDAYIFTGDVKYISTWLASCILRLKNKPVYFWTIGWHRPEQGVRNVIRLLFYRLADRLLLYGDPEKELAIKQGYPAERISVIYNSVSAVENIGVKDSSSPKEGNFIGAIARLTSAKRFGLLLDAAAIVQDRGHEIRIVLGGDGPERQTLEQKTKRLGLRCEFLGAVHDDAKIAEFYRRVSVSVIPSAAGLTTIQSLSHGVPVITDDDESTQAPEASAIIPGLTGTRYEATSASALADEIQTWLTLVTDNPEKIAEQCVLEVRSRWSPEVQATRMLEAIGLRDRQKASQ